MYRKIEVTTLLDSLSLSFVYYYYYYYYYILMLSFAIVVPNSTILSLQLPPKSDGMLLGSIMSTSSLGNELPDAGNKNILS